MRRGFAALSAGETARDPSKKRVGLLEVFRRCRRDFLLLGAGGTPAIPAIKWLGYWKCLGELGSLILAVP